MIRRNTWILLALFIVLLGAVWLLQRSKTINGVTSTPTSVENFLFNNISASLTRLRVQDTKNNVVVLDRDPSGSWTLKEPPGKPTDAGLAEQTMSQLASLSAVTEITQTLDLNAYGVATPVYTITVTLSGGLQHTVLVGKETPTSSGYYVLVDKSSLVVVSKYGMDAFLNVLSNPPILVTPTVTPGLTVTITSTVSAITSTPIVTGTIEPSTTPTSIPQYTTTPILVSPTPLTSPQPTPTK
jgi:hypothetical protein